MKRIFLILVLLIQTALFSQQKWDIRFYNEIVGRDIEVFADNNEPMPMSAQFNFKLNNLASTLSNDEIVVIPANSKRFLITKFSEIKPNTLLW